jgi:hypothetical protein
MAISKVSSPIAMFSFSMYGDGEDLRSYIGWMLKVANT